MTISKMNCSEEQIEIRCKIRNTTGNVDVLRMLDKYNFCVKTLADIFRFLPKPNEKYYVPPALGWGK